MTATPKFSGTIQQGKPVLDNMGKYRAYLAGFKEHTRIELVLRKQTKKRSDPQNRYYWAVVVPMLAEHFGYTKDEMHFWLKYLFLNEGTPEQPKVGSTTKLSTEKFNEYLENIQRWAAENFSIVIPDPAECEY